MASNTAIQYPEDVYVVREEIFFEEEDIMKYRPGGYHPVKLGDVYHSRYIIRHKLGHGGRSTVWLAWDKEDRIWVSIKIKTAASSTSVALPSLGEVESLRRLYQASGWGHDPATRKIVVLLDQFAIQGPNGTHQCLVFELLGPSIATVLRGARDHKEDFPAELFTARQIYSWSIQLLQVVKFIHAHGISHGDIGVNNLVFSFDTLARMPEKNLFKLARMPNIVKVKRKDGAELGPGVPAELISAADWRGIPLSKMTAIKLIDFGESFEGTIESSKVAQPPGHCALEGVLLGRLGLEADLWRTGITMYNISTGFSIMSGASNAYIVDVCILLLARLPPGTQSDAPQDWPPTWCAAWNRIRVDAISKGEYRPSNRVPEPILRGMFLPLFNERPSHYQVRLLWPIIEGLLQLLPEKRISSSQALEMTTEASKEDGLGLIENTQLSVGTLNFQDIFRDSV